MLQLEKFDADLYGRYLFILTDICKRILVEVSDRQGYTDKYKTCDWLKVLVEKDGKGSSIGLNIVMCKTQLRL